MFQSKLFLAHDSCPRPAQSSVVGWLAAVLAISLGVMRTTAADPQPNGDRIPTANGDLTIRPIDHATFVMSWNGKTIYVDPVGGGKRFESFSRPDLILITDSKGLVTQVSPSAETILGFLPEELVGRNTGELVVVTTPAGERRYRILEVG